MPRKKSGTGGPPARSYGKPSPPRTMLYGRLRIAPSDDDLIDPETDEIPGTDIPSEPQDLPEKD
ncbi:MAG TPA: hypothetical protein PKV67_03135 [Hyphomonas sp.]|nr:hypothetical protein [Hyphomonas sp.]HRK66043.1 hypothetical protein [Hyphomonas sp.]